MDRCIGQVNVLMSFGEKIAVDQLTVFTEYTQIRFCENKFNCTRYSIHTRSHEIDLIPDQKVHGENTTCIIRGPVCVRE